MKPSGVIVGLGTNEWSGKLEVGSWKLGVGSWKFSGYTKNSWIEIPIPNPEASGPNSKRVLQEENLSIYLIKKPKQMRDKRWETD